MDERDGLLLELGSKGGAAVCLTLSAGPAQATYIWDPHGPRAAFQPADSETVFLSFHLLGGRIPMDSTWTNLLTGSLVCSLSLSRRESPLHPACLPVGGQGHSEARLPREERTRPAGGLSVEESISTLSPRL